MLRSVGVGFVITVSIIERIITRCQLHNKYLLIGSIEGKGKDTKRSLGYNMTSMQQLSPEALVQGLIWYVVFLFSTTCHEASHSLAAKWGGDLTAFRGGQVTLNPLPHMKREPFGMLVVPLLSFLLGDWMIGWASAPYDPF